MSKTINCTSQLVKQCVLYKPIKGICTLYSQAISALSTLSILAIVHVCHFTVKDPQLRHSRMRSFTINPIHKNQSTVLPDFEWKMESVIHRLFRACVPLLVAELLPVFLFWANPDPNNEETFRDHNEPSPNCHQNNIIKFILSRRKSRKPSQHHWQADKTLLTIM